MTQTLRTALTQATARLDQADSALFDAQLLLAHVLGKPRSWLYAWPDHVLAASELEHFHALIERRAGGEPVAYLTGKREFWTFELQVNPAVLIPRPETELLVELALQLGKEQPGPVADLGTGSGAIALALALERPDWQIHATEVSEAALQVAVANVRQSGLANVQLHAGSWCAPLPADGYRLIVSNPPYIDANDPHLAALASEPRTALVAAEQGLADLRTIAGEARSKLAIGGWLLLEHGWQQGAAVRELLTAAGYGLVATRQDHGGRDRVTLGRWMGSEQ